MIFQDVKGCKVAVNTVNEQTGNSFTFVLVGSGEIPVYSESFVKDGCSFLVQAGINHECTYWATIGNADGLAFIHVDDWPCLDDALQGLEEKIESFSSPGYWYAPQTLGY